MNFNIDKINEIVDYCKQIVEKVENSEKVQQFVKSTRDTITNEVAPALKTGIKKVACAANNIYEGVMEKIEEKMPQKIVGGNSFGCKLDNLQNFKSDVKSVAAFIAAAIWADNQYDDAEKSVVNEIAKAFKMEDLPSAVETELDIIKTYDGQGIVGNLKTAGEGVKGNDNMYIFEAVMYVLLSDNILSYQESCNLMTAADILGLDKNIALLMLADKVKDEPLMKVEFK